MLPFSSSVATAEAVLLESLSQSSEMSSSVAPMPVGFSGDSENGSRLASSVAGVVPLLPLCPGMAEKR